jgi:hypothetical protein
MNPAMPPSELVVASALRCATPAFSSVCAEIPGLKKIAATYYRPDPMPESAEVHALAA